MNARYLLSEYPCSFNFLDFLVASTTLGATNIVFDKSIGIKHKYPDHITEERIKSILEPACALADATYSWGITRDFIDPGYHLLAPLKAFKEKGYIKKLKSVLPPKEGVKYTVTIRMCDRRKERNSNGIEWMRFAREIGALVIPDYADKPIHLHERMAIYAGAEMNFFVANGPGSLCMYSDYPYVQIMSNVRDGYHDNYGYPIGSQLPWNTPRQRAFWCNDSYDNIRAAAREMGI